VQAIRQRVLNDSTYINSRDYIRNTPLLTAIGFGNLELVEFLLQHGADPNVPVDDVYTCLLLAVESDDSASAAIVEQLIKAGADIRKTGTNGWTPLHMAANCGHIEKAKILIQAGAEVNRQTDIDGGNTALMEAARSGNAEMVQLLLDHGADPSVKNWISEENALEIAKRAAAGPDMDTYHYLKAHPIRMEDIGQMLDGVGMSDDSKNMMKELMANTDRAEQYLQSSKKLAETGNHADVIRILADRAGLS
jgi:ankyrin repeat protein